MEENQCEFCHKIYKNKYILKVHLTKCKHEQKKDEIQRFSCKGCPASFDRKYNLERHRKICDEMQQQKIKEYQELNELKEENKKMKQYLLEIEKDTKLKESYHLAQLLDKDKQIEKLNNIIEKTLSDSIKKSTTTTFNQHTQNISFRDCLSTEKTVDQLNESHLVERLRISMTEKMFFGGLRDIARMCYDYIIKLKDGKMILCCTDVSRNKFKMYDLHGNIKEDIEARYFTEKVGKCIKVAGTEIYNCVMQSIEDEKSMLTETDFKRKEELLDKFKRTCDAYIEIINVDDPERNNEFINELAALTSVHAINIPLEPNTNPRRLVY